MNQPNAVKSVDRDMLQGAMSVMAAMAGGIEEAVGTTAENITYLAGVKLGKQFSEDAQRTTVLSEALEELKTVLRRADCQWHFEVFAPGSREPAPDTDEHVDLVFRDCMIRQSLFLYGHHQKGSLCNMMFGFFSGALETIMGRQSRLEIIHAGENACLKRLSVSGAGSSHTRVQS